MKKIWPDVQSIIGLLPKNLSLSSKKYRVGIREKTYSGSRSSGQKAQDPGSGSATLLSRYADNFVRKRDRIGVVFYANPDPDRHQRGNSDPDRHHNDADPQH
jgi:hypothetical protein